MFVGHMSFRQRLGDSYWVALGYGQQWRSRSWRGHASVNITLARVWCAEQFPGLLMHLKVPKAASTTLFDVLYALAPKNDFAVNSRPLYVDTKRPRHSAAQYAAYLAALPKNTARTAHGPYLDFATLGVASSRPAYVALVREPARRLASHYNYIHWGPRSRWARFWKGQNSSAPAFESCVAQKMAKVPLIRDEDKGDCLYWANVQLAYFCGLGCQHLDITYGNAGPRYLERALANIQRDFVAVGIVEEIDASLRLFAAVLPSFFRGAPDEARGIVARATTHHDPEPSLTPRGFHAFLANTVLPYEYQLYAALNSSFQLQLAACRQLDPKNTDNNVSRRSKSRLRRR